MEGQRTPGLAWTFYAEGPECTLDSHTGAMDCWAMVGFTSHTGIQHTYRELQKWLQNPLPAPASPARCRQAMKYPKMKW